MTKEEREISIEYLEGIKDNYIEGYGYERHPLPEYYAIENAIKALEQESVINKISAEIEKYIDKEKLSFGGQFDSGLNLALKIINKYKAESEEV